MLKNVSKKKIIIFILICAVVFAASVVITYMLLTSSERKLSKQLAIANRYLDDGDYDKAIAAFEDALKIDPTCPEAYLGEAEAYSELGQQAEKSGDRDAALEYYQKGIDICGKGLSRTGDDRLKEYEETINERLDEINAGSEENENISGQAESAKNAEANIPDETAKINTIAERLLEEAAADIEKMDIDALRQLDVSDDVSTVADYLMRENKRSIVYSTSDKKLAENYTGTGAALYLRSDGGYFFYYGAIENDMRNGAGTAASQADYPGSYTYLTANWVDNVPQGEFREWTDYGDDTTYDDEVTGTCTDGLYDGSIDEVFYLDGDDINYEYGPNLYASYTADKGIVRHDPVSDEYFDTEPGQELIIFYSNDRQTVVTATAADTSEPMSVYRYWE